MKVSLLRNLLLSTLLLLAAPAIVTARRRHHNHHHHRSSSRRSSSSSVECSNELCFRLVGPDWVCRGGRCKKVPCTEALDRYVCEELGIRYECKVDRCTVGCSTDVDCGGGGGDFQCTQDRGCVEKLKQSSQNDFNQIYENLYSAFGGSNKNGAGSLSSRVAGGDIYGGLYGGGGGDDHPLYK